MIDITQWRACIGTYQPRQNTMTPHTPPTPTGHQGPTIQLAVTTAYVVFLLVCNYSKY